MFEPPIFQNLLQNWNFSIVTGILLTQLSNAPALSINTGPPDSRKSKLITDMKEENT